MYLTQETILRIAGISNKEDVLMKSIAIGLVTVTGMVVFLGACCGGGTTNVEVQNHINCQATATVSKLDPIRVDTPRVQASFRD